MAGILSQNPPEIAPAPWHLRGDGYMIFYKFSRAFIEQEGILPPEWPVRFAGFFGAIMLVDYRETPVGPYRELLFIPGKFNTPLGKKMSITHISVDSEASTRSGRANWGIPKVTHAFAAHKNGNAERQQVFAPDGQPFFDIEMRHYGPSFPITTALIPMQLYQILDGKTFLTKPTGSGWAKLARVESLKINKHYFPNVSDCKPLLALRVQDFKMVFPAVISQ